MTFKEWLPLIDTSENGRVTKKELKAYFKTYVEDNKCGVEPEDIGCPFCTPTPIVEVKHENVCHKCAAMFNH